MSFKTPDKNQSLQPAVKSREAEWPEKTSSAQDAYKNDILVSLRELKAGEVIDADESLLEIRRELGIDAN